MTPTIGINDFCRRQTEKSSFSHFVGGDEMLIALTKAGFSTATQGDREGVLKVSVNPGGFFCGVTRITRDTQLVTRFEARREGERPYKQTRAVGAVKAPAEAVTIIIYSREALAEDDDNSTDCDWEIVSINACATHGEQPPTPVSMMRNFLGLAGGTRMNYDSGQWARSIKYWSEHAMVEEQE